MTEPNLDGLKLVRLTVAVSTTGKVNAEDVRKGLRELEGTTVAQRGQGRGTVEHVLDVSLVEGPT